eukprot:TRINITY_DN3542_c0_g1_i1.p1 TRINITY_DN3542_c0_g1~~TRINITY_DN3542_c0_g1_i1.p1  ORF type:complete len:342 (+),score=87.78 TRINITY_DN3542_c0_g1_i1:1-1026(+)
MFVIFNGTYASLLQTVGLQQARRRLVKFFDFYIPTIKFSQLPQQSEIAGFQYLPVDRAAFLMSHSLARTIKNNFPAVHSVSIIYDHKLVHSELDQNDMKLLFDLEKDHMRQMFTYATLIEKDDDDDPRDSLSLDTKLRRNSREMINAARGRFLTGPARVGIRADVAPIVHLSSKFEPYRLVVYVLGSITLIMTLHDDADHTHKKTSFYDAVEDFFRGTLDKLVKSFSQQAVRPQGDELRYVYLNKINLALKSSVQTKNTVLTSEAVKVMRSLHKDFDRCEHRISEVCVKTRTDGWVVGRHASETHREYFIVMEDVLNNEFSDVHDAVNDFVKNSVNDVCLL